MSFMNRAISSGWTLHEQFVISSRGEFTIRVVPVCVGILLNWDIQHETFLTSDRNWTYNTPLYSILPNTYINLVWIFRPNDDVSVCGRGGRVQTTACCTGTALSICDKMLCHHRSIIDESKIASICLGVTWQLAQYVLWRFWVPWCDWLLSGCTVSVRKCLATEAFCNKLWPLTMGDSRCDSVWPKETIYTNKCIVLGYLAAYRRWICAATKCRNHKQAY